MEKKALLGKIFLLIVLFVVLAGALAYFQIREDGIKVTTGDVTISFDYTPEDGEGEIVEVGEEGNIIGENNSSDNETLLDVTDDNNTLINESVP